MSKQRGDIVYKILLVDDESNIVFLMERSIELMSDSDIEILKAGNGKDALDLIIKEKPDMVFLDVMMPEMDGFEVCRKVRQEYNNKETYIIILTAKGEERDKVNAIQAGANEFMTKPFDPSEMIDKIKSVLKID